MPNLRTRFQFYTHKLHELCTGLMPLFEHFRLEWTF